MITPSECASGGQMANSACAPGALVTNLSARTPRAQASAANSPFHQAAPSPSDPLLKAPLRRPPSPARWRATAVQPRGGGGRSET